MNTLNKTPKGTIGAFRWVNGICLGIYGEGNCISLEYNQDKNVLELLLNDEEMKRQGISVVHVGKNWE